ncbi:putative KAP-like P-loop ATPase [Myroides gitamensis]|uniref:KAP family P-loop NTPase fold protein n=1 Tax=Myroides odoratus TaxID=256 RepID=UPI002167D289|nr:KAP family NTPase [Myroides odoratus]MCS4238683.1 putative KAP-like P-loop ATPase [Myroides odoratus]MDH6600383.1 putative KAP-like P-loop ATPase [Myroides gitamensis]
MNNKYKWSNKDTITLKLCLILIIVFISFESKIMGIYNKEILSVLSEVEENVLPFVLILITSIAYCIFKFSNWHTNKVFTPYRYLISVGCFVITYIYYRWITKQYIAYPNYCGIGLSDLLVFLLIVITVYRGYINLKQVLIPNSNVEKSNIDYCPDFSIQEQKYDLLKLDQKIKQVKLRIDNLSVESHGSTSIGIIGKWGQGKSSFLNLLKEQYDKDGNENVIINFNPRYSKDLKSIPFDFFELLISKLKTYNIEFSNTFKEYLNAIKVIDKTRILEALTSSPVFLDKELTKDNLNTEFRKIGKKIIVFIDDLDRLQADEIIEIFKILDYTASFSNVVFITAYDKDYVNGILDTRYHKAESFFSDKFFNKEIFLPPIGKDIIYKYLNEKIEQSFDKSTDEFEKIMNTLYIRENIIHKVFLSLRDVKRFLNIFIYRYHKLKGYLDFNDLFLLFILKSKWYDFYLFVYREYFNIYDEWILDKATANQKSEPLENRIIKNYLALDTNESNALKKHKDLVESILKEINFLETSRNNQKVLFENYFQEYEEDNDYKLTYKYIERFVNKEFSSIKLEIDWYFDKKKYNELCKFVGHFDLNNITSKSNLENYLDLLIYINTRSNNEQGTYFQLLKFFDKKDSNVISFKQNFEISDDNYKSLILEKLYIGYPHYPIKFIRNLISKLFPSEQLEGEITITQVVENHEILTLSKRYFEDYLKENPIFKKGHLDILYVCIEDIRRDFHRNIKLDEEICAKVEKLIRYNPSEYFKIALSYLHNEVYIEPFYTQLFKSNENFERFISDKMYDNIENANLVRNYWLLYKNNEYKSVSFNGFESMEQKINKEFKTEIKQLEQILKLKERFIEIEINNLNEFLKEVSEITKVSKFFTPSNAREFCVKATTNVEKVLDGLKKIKELILEAQSTKYSNFINIVVLQDLKYYQVRKLKLDGMENFDDIIQTVEKVKEEKKISIEILDKLQTSVEFVSLCYNNLEPSLNRIDEASFSIDFQDLVINIGDNSFDFYGGKFDVIGGLDSDINDKPIRVKVKVTGSGNYKLNENGNVKEVYNLEIDKSSLMDMKN